MENWKENLSKLKDGVFKDELKYCLNKLLEIPYDQQPTEGEVLSFVVECLKKDFNEVFVGWDIKKNDTPKFDLKITDIF